LFAALEVLACVLETFEVFAVLPALVVLAALVEGALPPPELQAPANSESSRAEISVTKRTTVGRIMCGLPSMKNVILVPAHYTQLSLFMPVRARLSLVAGTSPSLASTCVGDDKPQHFSRRETAFSTFALNLSILSD
jgi:hypothetical protein